MKNIVVAVDLSNNSSALVEQSVNLAKGFSSNVYLVHVENPNEDTSGREIAEGVEAVVKEYHEETELLNSLAQTIRDRGIDTHAVFVEGAIVEAVLEESLRLNANVIIAGTHCHNALEGFLLGSVSGGIVKRSPCPVLLVPLEK